MNFLNQQKQPPKCPDGVNTQDHNVQMGQVQRFRNDAGGRGGYHGRGFFYQRPGRGRLLSDRRVQMQSRDGFRDGTRGSGQGASNSTLVPVNGFFHQTPLWDRERQLQGGLGSQQGNQQGAGRGSERRCRPNYEGK